MLEIAKAYYWIPISTTTKLWVYKKQQNFTKENKSIFEIGRNEREKKNFNHCYIPFNPSFSRTLFTISTPIYSFLIERIEIQAAINRLYEPKTFNLRFEK